MNHLEFLPYRNRHIRFHYRGQWRTGVILDEIPYDEKKKSTDYILIPTSNLKEWRTADIVDDAETKGLLQEVIDIIEISEAELNYEQTL